MFIKICGITNEEDALLAVAMGADAIGFIFAPSTRQVVPAAVARITSRLPPEVLTVGVFRDDLPQRVIDVVREAGLQAAQVHGHASADDVALVASQVRHVIRAYSATSSDLADAFNLPVDAIHVDAPEPGSGVVFDWRLAEALPRARRIILAGGLSGDNVALAISRVHPWGVDASTGLESSPGRKDPAKMRAFVQAARSASPAESESSFDGPYDWQQE